MEPSPPGSLATISVHELLHRLWTKAVGTEGYDKEEWRELERRVEDLT